MMKSLKQIRSWIPSDRNIQIIMLAGAIVIGVGALGGGFMWYRIQREQQASRAFIDAIDQLEQARSDQTDQAWENAREAFAYGFEQFKNASIAGYFLAYQADILDRQGKHDEACEMLDHAVDYMPRDATLYYAYSLRLALMYMDATDDALRDKGSKLLIELSDNPHNPLRDMALYYHGLYYFNRQDREAARTAWEPLFNPDNFDQTSAWASRAHAKLAYDE